MVVAFGEALAPLMEASIRMIYLGAIGWIGSTVTLGGITVLLHVKPETDPKTPKKAEAKAEQKNIGEAWEKALQETKLTFKPA